MFQYLYFCCQENQKDQPNTVSLEDVISHNQKNTDNLNYTTQGNNNPNIIEESYINNNKDTESKFYQNDVLISNKGLFINENALYNNTNQAQPILTINNINNININVQRNSFSKDPIKLLDKKDSQSNDNPKNNLDDLIKPKTIISGENSKDQYQCKSFISFSNLTIKYNNNNNIVGSSINFSDTEIMSSCELTLIGDLFFNKEIKIDRSGIKNPLITNTNRFKNKNKKACELKLGVVNNTTKGSSSTLIGKNLEDKNNINNNTNMTKNRNSSQNLNENKNNKLISIKSSQKKKIQNMCSITSLTNSMLNKNNIDILLNLSYSKLQKKIKENSNNDNNNENIVLFILKYDTALDMFQLTSIQDSVPVELLLNYNYPLRFQQNYNILIGSIKLKLKVIKNEKNESILNISYLNIDENNDNNNKKEEEKKEIFFKFNPFIDKMPITIGRINCDINLNNISVSKLHAQIDYIYDYDEYFITDCKSTNGTFLLLKNSLNSIFIKRELHFKLFESKFKIQYVNFDN